MKLYKIYWSEKTCARFDGEHQIINLCNEDNNYVFVSLLIHTNTIKV